MMIGALLRHPGRMTSDQRVPGLLITGTIGSGKTALAVEIGEVLGDKGFPTAVVDLDWLGWVTGLHGDDRDYETLILENLTAMWPNFVGSGAHRIVMARVVQNAEHVRAIRDALPEVDLRVVLVTASQETIAERLRRRDTGGVLEEHLEESIRFAGVVEGAAVEDVAVSNEDKTIRDLAIEVLHEVGWLDERGEDQPSSR